MKILLAVDDSRFSGAAAQAVIRQFKPDETEVRVLHVVEPISFTPPPQMAPQYYPELQEQVREGEKVVEKVAKTLRDAGFQATTLVEKGEARGLILDQANSWPADVIVLGAHGKKGLTRFLLGSVSEAVARHASCSVIIVRIPEER
jgi:nucleotide-binding universal stress UspA family protein